MSRSRTRSPTSSGRLPRALTHRLEHGEFAWRPRPSLWVPVPHWFQGGSWAPEWRPFTMPMTPSEETHAARLFRNAAVVHAVPFARWQPFDSGTPWVRCSSSSTQATWVLQREARLPILGAGGRVSPPAEDAPEGTAVADVAAPGATAAADQTRSATPPAPPSTPPSSPPSPPPALESGRSNPVEAAVSQ